MRGLAAAQPSMKPKLLTGWSFQSSCPYIAMAVTLSPTPRAPQGSTKAQACIVPTLMFCTIWAGGTEMSLRSLSALMPPFAKKWRYIKPCQPNARGSAIVSTSPADFFSSCNVFQVFGSEVSLPARSRATMNTEPLRDSV